MLSVGPAGRRKASLFHPGTHRLPLHARPSQGGHGEVPCKCEQGASPLEVTEAFIASYHRPTCSSPYQWMGNVQAGFLRS